MFHFRFEDFVHKVVVQGLLFVPAVWALIHAGAGLILLLAVWLFKKLLKPVVAFVRSYRMALFLVLAIGVMMFLIAG